MSVERKFSFYISILLCVVTILVFFLIPCGRNNCGKIPDENPNEWLGAITNIELKGPIILIPSINGHNGNSNYDILLLAQGSIFSDTPIMRTHFTSSTGGDICAINGTNGEFLWRKHYNKIPDEIECGLFAINNRVPTDCVIVNYGNYIALISSKNGRSWWNLSLINKNIKMNRIFPQIIPDMNNDHVADLMLITDKNKITLISGRNGAIISRDFYSNKSNCTQINDFRVHNESSLQIGCCIDNKVTYLDLISTNTISQPLIQHRKFKNVDQIKNHTIYILNYGHLCPKSCTTQIEIKDENAKVCWSFSRANSFTFAPSSFTLNVNVEIKGYFVKTWEFKKQEQMTNRKNEQIYVNYLDERIVMIIINSAAEMPVIMINISSNMIIQLCSFNNTVQPDPIFQNYSLLYADVGNNMHQLITFHTTFEIDKFYVSPVLRSYIRKYWLEKRLFKTKFI